jgi:hypothetical protein
MNRSGAVAAGEAWHHAKYVDILAFCHLLFVNWPVVAGIASMVVGAIAVGWLAQAWWRSDGSVVDGRLWGATICFTLAINLYTPIYDTVLVVIAMALVVSERQAVGGWLLALYLIPWVTQSFAEFLHLQLMTLALAAFGIWLMEIAGNPRVSHSKPRQEESTMTGHLQPQATGRFQVRSRGLP